MLRTRWPLNPIAPSKIPAIQGVNVSPEGLGPRRNYTRNNGPQSRQHWSWAILDRISDLTSDLRILRFSRPGCNEAKISCRRKMRMSGFCKVEMSAFIDGRGPYGNGANHLEPTRTGPIESVARGEAEASFAGSSSGAVEGNRPPGAANAAADSRARGWCPGSRTTRPAIKPQGSSAFGAEDSGAPTPALCGFRTHAGRRTPGQGRSLGES